MPVIAHLLKATVPAVILGAGLTLASNATASANTPGQDSQTLSPQYITSCSSFVRRSYPSYNSAYCQGGDGATFRAWIYCQMDDGSYQYHYGPWELASDNQSSVAECGENGVWASDGINKNP